MTQLDGLIPTSSHNRTKGRTDKTHSIGTTTRQQQWRNYSKSSTSLVISSPTRVSLSTKVANTSFASSATQEPSEATALTIAHTSSHVQRIACRWSTSLWKASIRGPMLTVLGIRAKVGVGSITIPSARVHACDRLSNPSTSEDPVLNMSRS
jgi:hypothetical protein